MTFHYYNQDHLGNNREVVNENGTIEQVTNYYPFGAPYCELYVTISKQSDPWDSYTDTLKVWQGKRK